MYRDVVGISLKTNKQTNQSDDCRRIGIGIKLNPHFLTLKMRK